jgi:MFS family permease
MSGLFGAVFGLSSVVGPTLGGFLTDGPGWRWVFYVNIPLGIAAVILVASQLPFVRSGARLRDIDWVGTGLLFAGLTPLLIALSMTRDHAWVSPQVLGLLAVSGVALAAFYLIERRVEHPVVPFQLFKLNVFAVPAVISFFSGIGMFGAVIFVPLLYQGVLGVSATNSGQLLTPIIIIGAGLGVTFPLTLVVIQAGLPHQLIGVGTSQLTFWRSLGGTIGTAILGSVLTNRMPVPYSRLGLASTLHDLFLAAAVVAAVSVIASVFLREVPLTREAEGVPVEIETAA